MSVLRFNLRSHISVLYTVAIIAGLIVLGVISHSGTAFGLSSNSDVSVSADASTYYLGDTVFITGTLALSADETVSIKDVILQNTAGEQSMSTVLPLSDTSGSFVDITNSNIKGTMSVKVTYSGMTGSTLPSTLPSTLSNTLPGTLPLAGDFTAGNSGANIEFIIKWTPPINLDPAPSFTLITNASQQTDIYWDIPTPSIASDAVGTKFPDTDLVAIIPIVGQVSGTSLPNATSTFNVPQIIVPSNAASWMPSLPDTTASTSVSNAADWGWDIPRLTIATSTLTEFPEFTQSFAIQVAGGSDSSSIPNFGDANPSKAFDLPSDINIKGITYDSTNSAWWAIKDGGWNNDTLIKIDPNSYVASSTTAMPSSEFSGIVAIGGNLYISENEWRCYDQIESNSCQYSHRVFVISASDLPGDGSQSAWSTGGKSTSILHPADDWTNLGGLTEGASGSIWSMDKWGGQLFNFDTSGNRIGQQIWQDNWYSQYGIAYNAGIIYTTDGSQITQWTEEGNWISDTSTGTSGVNSLTFSTYLYMGQNNGDLYYAELVDSVSTDEPLGIAYSGKTSSAGEAIWVILNASPKDKILKMNTTTGALVTAFDSDGVADGPSSGLEGITFLSNFLYIVANDGTGWDKQRRIYKVNPANGTVSATYNLDAWDDIGGITNDGEYLYTWTKSMFNDVKKFESDGSDTYEMFWPCCPSVNGAKGLAYHSVTEQFYAVSGTNISAFDSTFNSTQDYYVNDKSTNTTSISGIQGLEFDGNTVYAVANDQVYKAAIVDSMTTKPLGMAYSPPGSAAGDALWILVDATPKDKLLKVNSSTGALITAFDGDGVADAPAANMEAMTYLADGSTSYLYMISNDSWEKRTLWQYNAKTAVVSNQWNLAQMGKDVWDDIGGMTSDADGNLVIFAKQNNMAWIFDTSGERQEEKWPWGSMEWGAGAAARHASKDSMYISKSTTLISVDTSSSEWQQTDSNFLIDDSSMNGTVGAMTFAGDMLFVARKVGSTGYVTSGALKDDVTTKPIGLAISPSDAIYKGQSIGQALWILVDATPKDKIIKYNTSTGVVTGWGTAGAVDAPTGNARGITFLDNAIWVTSDSGYDPTLYKLNPNTGATLNTYPLCGMGMMMCQVGDSIGGLANDGTDLLLGSRGSSGMMGGGGGNESRIYTVDTSGVRQSENNICCPNVQNIEGFDYLQSSKSYFLAKDDNINQFITVNNNVVFTGTGYDVGSGSASLDEVKGLVINQGTQEIYMGWYDSGNSQGKISLAVPPSPYTNNPRDVAYDAASGTLYVLVDGKGEDAVAYIDPSDGSLKTDVLSDGYFGVGSEDAEALLFDGEHLYVSYQQDMMGGPPQQGVVKFDPADGTKQGNTPNAPDDCGQIKGWTWNGSDILASSSHCGPQLRTIKLSNMNEQDRLYIFDPMSPMNDEGFTGIAFSTSTPMYYLAKGSNIYRVLEDGFIQETYDLSSGATAVTSLQGIDFVGNSLYLVENDNNTIRKALIPLPPQTASNDPRGMASDGTYFYLAVDAEPVDKIMVIDISTSTANVVNTYDSHGTNTQGIAYLNGQLYVIANEFKTVEKNGQRMQINLPVLGVLDPATGEILGEGPMIVDYGNNPPPGQPAKNMLWSYIGGVTTDGTNLYAGSNGENGFDGMLFRVEQNMANWSCMDFTGFQVCGPTVYTLPQFSGVNTRINSFQSMEWAPSMDQSRKLITAGSEWFGSNAEYITRFNPDVNDPSGGSKAVTYDQYQITGADIKGLALDGTILYMADDASDKMIGTSLPENTGIEMTVVGSYTTQMSATTGSNTYTGNVSYTIGKKSSINIKATAPSNNFVSTQASTVISGYIDDSSVSTVSLGIQLPFTDFVSDAVLTDGTSAATWVVSQMTGGDANWHINCKGSSGFAPPVHDANDGSGQKCAWRFGRPGQNDFNDTVGKQDYEDYAQTQGGLATVNKVPMAAASQMTFMTAYQTEFFAEMDRKIIEVAKVSSDIQGNDVVGSYEPIAQVVLDIDEWASKPMGHAPGFVWVTAEPMSFNKQMQQITIDLSAYQGQNVKIRFRFDSGDGWGNDGPGWYIDNIKISGSGEKTVSVPTTVLDTPVVEVIGTTSIRWVKSFITNFDLAEGENTVVMRASQPYSALVDSATLQGFVDTQAPALTIGGLPQKTNVVKQQLTGTINDITLQIMTVSQMTTDQDTGETSSVAIYSLKQVPNNNTFIVNVSLSNGPNVFTITALDRGGLSTTKSATVISDQTNPTATVKVVAENSTGQALYGDSYFIVVAAADPLSGVANVELDVSGNSEAFVPVGQVPSILSSMYSLGDVSGATTTHVLYRSVPSDGSIPIGVNSLNIDITDNAGNTARVNGDLDVRSQRTNRNYYLLPGFNFMGLALIPDDNNASTAATCPDAGCAGTEDSSLDRLMGQDITDKVNPALATALGGTVTFGDVVESIMAFNYEGNFTVYQPGDGATDTLTELEPFQGMLVKLSETYATSTIEVFKKVSVAGYTSQQTVPIALNIQGVFFNAGELPPDKTLRVGYNLVAPHTLSKTPFNTVFRGALIPNELAVSAITFKRSVSATAGTASISASVFEGFETLSGTSNLEPQQAYWTFIVNDPANKQVVLLTDGVTYAPKGPTITP